MVCPARPPSGRWASVKDIDRAPSAGAARNTPSPHGPVCRISRAKIGSNAVAPPSNTANRSREMAPSTTGRVRMKWIPEKTDFSVVGSFRGMRWANLTNPLNNPAPRKSAVATAYGAVTPKA